MTLKLHSARYKDVVRKTSMGLCDQLWEAIRSKDVHKVTSVIESGSRVKGHDEDLDLEALETGGCTALGLAAQEGHVEIVTLLMQHGCNVNKPDFYGQTPLHYASENGYTQVVQVLIKAGADVDWMDVRKDGLSSLHVAACKGHTEVAKALIEAKCDVNVKDINGVSVLHCAVANGHQAVVEVLLQARVHVNPRGTTTNRTPLFLACETGQLDMVRLLLKHRAKVNVKDDYGMTPLCAVCIQNNSQLARCLLDNGSKVNLCDNKQNMPLHYAARNGNLELMEMLIESGSEMNAVNRHGATALHMAIQMNHTDSALLLLKHNADPNLCTSSEVDAPLHTAVRSYRDIKDFEQLIRHLVDYGCDLDLQGHDAEESSLFTALSLGKGDFAVCLLQHGANPNIDCPFDVTVLYKSCERKLTSAVITLLHTCLDWNRETWLYSDIHTSGINPKLLAGYAENIPRVLLQHLDLFSLIQHVQSNPSSLAHLCRSLIRKLLTPGLHGKIARLGLPKRLENYVMLKTL